MVKQTVNERYNEQQMMKTDIKPKDKVNMETKSSNEQNTQKILNAMKQSLQEAHQAVRQSQMANPTQSNLQLADMRLQNATQLLQKLQTTVPEMTLGYSKGEKQQFKQLDYQIEKAIGTLQTLMQSMTSN